MKTKVYAKITFCEELKAAEISKILCHIADVFGVGCWKLNPKRISFENSVDYDDATLEKKLVSLLLSIGGEKDILSGEVRCAKEGVSVTKPKPGAFWRLIYQHGLWTAQEGHVTYAPEAERMKTLSTVHLTPKTLNELIRGDEHTIVAFGKRIDALDENVPGAIILVEKPGDDLPDDLNKVLQWALDNEFDWLNVDCDALEVNELPAYRYEWDKELGLSANGG